MTCPKCNQNQTFEDFNLCAECIVRAIKKLPNEYCIICQGLGRYLDHSPDCTNEDCTLADNYGDCAGVLIECSCSHLEGLPGVVLAGVK